MQNSENIKMELDETTVRLNELYEMRQGIEGNLKALQSGFIKRKKTLDELQIEQSKLTILNDSIKSLEATKSELQTAFDEADATERRKILLEAAKAKAVETATDLDEYMQLHGELNNLISEAAEKMFGKISSYRAKQNEYQQTLSRIEPGITSLFNFQQGEGYKFSQLNRELEAAGLSKQIQEKATTANIFPPVVEFSEAIAIAERIVNDRHFRQAKTEREQAQKAAV